MSGIATSYRGRTAALATRHHKHALIAPALTPLGLTVMVADDVDTDLFGTFTGDRARAGTAHETVTAKARAALRSASLPLGLASEGTFGPHPESPWVAVNTELVALVDDRIDLVVVGRAHSTETTWAAHAFTSQKELHRFLTSIAFPAQGVVVHPEDHPAEARKGITDLPALQAAISGSQRRHPGQQVLVVADLRAHHNPRRRAVIRSAATDLAVRLASSCPACSSPGYGFQRNEPGLPCASCGTVTEEIAVRVWSCPACHLEHPDPVIGPADPAQCPRCNP